MTVFGLETRARRPRANGPGPAAYAPVTPPSVSTGVRYIDDVVPSGPLETRTSWVNGVSYRNGLATTHSPSRMASEGASSSSTGVGTMSPVPPSSGTSRAGTTWGASRHAALARANTTMGPAARHAPFSTTAPRDMRGMVSKESPGPKYNPHSQSTTLVPKFGPAPSKPGTKSRRAEPDVVPCPEPGIGIEEMGRAERRLHGTRQVAFGSKSGNGNSARYEVPPRLHAVEVHAPPTPHFHMHARTQTRTSQHPRMPVSSRLRSSTRTSTSYTCTPTYRFSSSHKGEMGFESPGPKYVMYAHALASLALCPHIYSAPDCTPDGIPLHTLHTCQR